MSIEQMELPLESRGAAPTLPRSGEATPAVHRNGRSGPDASPVMERVVEAGNLARALKRMRRNKGSPGVDGRTVTELAAYLREHWPAIREQLLTGRYQPSAVRRVELEKPGGGVRLLGIPTVLDRLIQQAVLQVLQPAIDPTFSESSHGFRPGRSAQDAVCQAQRYVQEDRHWVVEVDLAQFLDLAAYCPQVHEEDPKRSASRSMTLMRKPLRRPWVTRTASSSPRLTRCNTVCRDTPSFIVASSMGR